MSSRSTTAPVKSITARRALVLAPHYDDEILGCGGLVAKLVEDGTRVHVVFLTDSSGAAESGDRERAEIAQRRASEARSVADLFGWHQTSELGFPDGALEEHEEDLETAIRDLFERETYDLVLAPSPIENSDDHRVAARTTFALLHERWSDASIPGDAQLLFYEVNQPLVPDLLVDVSGVMPKLEQAMALYASQQELHDYLGAAIGLRRFRTLTLDPSVEAAEGYLRLDRDQIVTLGWNEVRDLARGDGPDVLELIAQRPTVSVVVRTKDRPEHLQAALASLGRSTMPPDQVVLVNDGGRAPEIPSDLPFEIDVIHHESSRGRAAAANTGVEACSAQAIGFLDDDDVVLAEHYELLTAALAAPGVDAAYTDAAVVTFQLDPPREGWKETGRRRPYSRDFDHELLLLDNYVPFHTLLMRRDLVGQVGPFDLELDVFEDWDFLIRLGMLTTPRHLPRVTCEYRHFMGHRGHALAGWADPDQQASFVQNKALVMRKHREQLTPETLARAVIVMRRELVGSTERLRGQATELAGAQRERQELRSLLERQREVGASKSRAWDIERAGLLQRLEVLEGSLASSDQDRRRLSAERDGLEQERDSYASQLKERDSQLQQQYDYSTSLQEAIGEREAELADRDAQIEELHRQIGDLSLQLGESRSLVEEMESTRAWRLHRAAERLRGRGQ